MKSFVLPSVLVAVAALASSVAYAQESTDPSAAPSTGSSEVALPPAASAVGPVAIAESPPVREVDHRVSMWRFELGYRGSFISDAGYAPFSTNGSLSQVSLATSRTLFARGPFSFAPGVAWDHGASSALARGDATSLSSDRLTVTLEGRVHLGAWGYGFVRAAPGIAIQGVEVDDASSPAPFTRTNTLFATDVSGGYAFMLWGRSDPASKIARLWLQAEGGYGWVASQRLSLAPNLSANDPQLVARIDLGSVSMSGGFFRVGAAVGF